jgi:hypothetical protein
MPGLRLSLGLGISAATVGAAGGPEAPIAVAWEGSHAIAEDAVLGAQVGGVLSATDPDGGLGVFTLSADAGGSFGIGPGGDTIIVTGVLDYETAPAPSITLRYTDADGLYVEQAFSVTVTNVSEAPPAEYPPPDDGDVVVEPGEFIDPPISTVVDAGIKLHGKKATGASGKFIYDLGAPAAGTLYTLRYDPDFSLLANLGVTAFVGFGMKQGNNFRLSGLKGDGGAGVKAFEIFGANWNQTTGFTTSDGGAAAHGTQAGPNWLQLEVAADGVTYTLRTSADGVSFADEFTAIVPAPHDDMVDDFTSFGIAVFLESADAGSFSVKVDLWRDVPLPTDITLSNSTVAANAGLTTIGTLAMVGGVAPAAFTIV